MPLLFKVSCACVHRISRMRTHISHMHEITKYACEHKWVQHFGVFLMITKVWRAVFARHSLSWIIVTSVRTWEHVSIFNNNSLSIWCIPGECMPLSLPKRFQYKLKTDNLCCPTIGPGYIKDGEKHYYLARACLGRRNNCSRSSNSSRSNCMQLKPKE